MAEDEGVRIHGNVYGGGNLADVKENTEVNMNGGTVAGNVFGGGKGEGSLFTCAKAMVGTEEADNACKEPGSNDYKDKGTKVTISNGTVGTLVGEEGSQTLKEGTGNVYGGGEIGRVEWNTQVLIGVGTGEGTFAPTIYGSVFGAGKGLSTHGYSALVRGNSTVTVQGNAKVGYNVYGGGEMSTVGRYWVKGIPTTVVCSGETPPTAPTDLPDGMPYKQRNGGICKVTIQGSAEIGYNGAADDKGHVFGAGKGVKPHFVASGKEGVSQKMTNTNVLVDFEDDAVTGKTAEELYLEFLQTLALVTNTDVTIAGSAKVKGSVYGGSESGFVQTNTTVKIQGDDCEIGTTTYGDVFGGGRGLEEFAEAGKVKGNTDVTISAGTVNGNVYGGGELGDVGIIDKTAKDNEGNLTYNYAWKQTDGTTANIAEYNKPSDSSHDTSKNTGICKVTITDGTIGSEEYVGDKDHGKDHGNVFGAGRGSSTTWWCEKAIAYATVVSIKDGTVYGNVYGGGQIGRVEDDGKVTIGSETDSGEGSKPDIKGDVFGAGAGLYTHGYSALVRGNSDVIVQGIAQVGGSVYGGGEVASVGRFTVVGGLPKHPDSGGTCMVTIQDNANIGTIGTVHNVYGACKGVNPADITERKSMQLYTNRPATVDPVTGEKTYKPKGEDWDYYYIDEAKTIKDERFVWVFYTEDNYPAFLETLALTSNPHVIIAENATVWGSVFGGGERGITLGNVDVDIIGGTVKQDVYGGGSLANTNKGNWEDSNGTWAAEKSSATYTTVVNLLDGTIAHDVYGGGLGDEAIEARVYGDVKVNLNGLVPDDYVASTHSSLVEAIDEDGDGTTDYYRAKLKSESEPERGCVVNGNIFGCNNVNGTPKGDVTVHVFKTVKKNESGVVKAKPEKNTKVYELAAVYGGGNQAAFDPENANNTRKTHVIIEGCALTSIEYVYGGGNAAAAPATWVEVNSCYEIGTVFAGGNGAGFMDPPTNSIPNPGANVGYKNDGTTAYGSGTALADLHGGTIHQAFGGSNTKGNIRESANVTLNEPDDNPCPLCIDEVYGAGNEAYQDGTSNIDLGCISYLKELYGGSRNANIYSDVVLNIVSGRFDRVFGGNNLGGLISGTITVNIEETGCHPIIIGQLYGGGNQASYTAPSGKHGPTVNVKSFTSIGEIYGGGYGAGATVTGDTYVNINVAVGDNANAEMAQKIDPVTGAPVTTTDPNDNTQTIPVYTDVSRNTGQWIHFVAGKNSDNTDKIETVWQPEHKRGEIGTIGNVFGGGNAAAVQGNTNVTIGNAEYVEITTNIVAGDTDVRGYYVSNNSTYTEISGSNPVLATANTKYYRKVIGVNITGNVYGGGNAANVSGDTNVIIGKETTTP